MKYYQTGSGHASGQLAGCPPTIPDVVVFLTAMNVGGVKWPLIDSKFESR
jgi:hypothetical protein